MKGSKTIGDLGESKIIEIIEQIVVQKTGKDLIKDDAFFYSLKKVNNFNKKPDTKKIVLNSDMLVSTTDVPAQMTYYHTGRKAVLMNVSDLIVKGVAPKGIIVSLGMPKDMKLEQFKELVIGIVEYCLKHDIEYLGGDVNETAELIVNPTVIGFQDSDKIKHRKGIQIGDIVMINGKFGLTGVGFHVILKQLQKKDHDISRLGEFSAYEEAIRSVLEPRDLGLEGLYLSDTPFVTGAIDSSDGLARSLRELMRSNPSIGFNINITDSLVHIQAKKFAHQYEVPIEELVFSGGEEFIHLFTVKPNMVEQVIERVKRHGGRLYTIGKVIEEQKIFIQKDGKRKELFGRGFEHFT